MNIFIAVPIYRYYIPYGLAIRLIEWSRRFDFVQRVSFFNGLIPPDLARNQIVEEFLKTSATHLLMIDDDIVPPPNALEKLISDDKDIVAGVYHAFVEDRDGRPQPPELIAFRDGERVHGKGLELIDGAGAGCLLVKRKVFEAIDPPWFELEFGPNHSHLTMTEDIYFLNLVKEHGFEVWADFDVQCGHVKLVDLRGVTALVA